MGLGQRIKSSSSFLCLLKASLRIAVGPKLALRDIREIGYLHADTEHLGLHRPIEKQLIPIYTTA